MKTKRTSNAIGLKVGFIPATNEKGNFFKLTQTNNKKSVLINGNIDTEIIQFIDLILSKDKKIKSFSLVIDNTQDKFYLFAIQTKTNEIHNILENFKNL